MSASDEEDGPDDIAWEPPETVQGHWQKFCDAAYGPAADPSKLYAVKIAYYAGASGALRVVEALGDPAVSEEDGARVLVSLRREIMGFFDRTADALRRRN